MPSKSPKQAKLMAMIAHNPAAARRTGVSPKVAREFNQADAGTGILRRRRPKDFAGRRPRGNPKY